jgi:aconitate decarboxylase
MKRQHRFGGDDVETVRIFTSSATKEHVGWPYRPDGVTTAQMNLPYIAAVTITDGEAFVDQFAEARIRDERVVALAGRVEVTVDPDIDARGDAFRHAIAIEVVLKDGRVLKDARDSARGSAANPMSREQVEAKYAELAGRVLPDARVGRVQELVYGVDTLADVRLLVRGFTPAGT